ncbi:MAG TPA: HDIG domain-containing protein [Longimicrobiales bacterium]|nr:HDIG domain-containing protein [Longimicrobiales bacterium]
MSRTVRGERPAARPSSGEPEGGLLHHGTRVLLLVVLASLTTVLFPPDSRLRMEQYTEGMIADADVLAEVQFTVPVTPEELEQARREARLAVPPTLDFRPSGADSTAAALERFFRQLEINLDRGLEPVTRILAERSIAVTPAQVELLRDPDVFSQIRQGALRATREILSGGVADGADLADARTSRVTIRDPAGAGERSVDRETVMTAREFLDRAVSLLPASLPPDAQEILRLILIQHMEYTYRLNVAATELDRDGAARAVPTVQQTVLQGEAIVRANEQITPAAQDRLSAYQSALRNQGMLDDTVQLRISPLVGAGLLNLLVLAVFGMFLYFFRREIYDETRWVLLVGILVAVYLLGAGVVERSDWPVEALPVVFSALAVAVLWDGRMALVLAMMLAVLSAIQTGLQGTSVLVPTFVGGAVAGMSVRVVRRRAQTWIFIALIFAAYTASILALALVYSRSLDQLGMSLLAAGGNSIVSAILAMGFVPVFEWMTGITTDQTLLEWGDPNRSLLRRLSMEAPGTYAHTINVVNLAEAGATAIGANGLLCRVGLYYHDVGKMLKPHYFVENQPDGRNPHDRLKPDTSATIIREHITEGHKLAKEEGVPDVIADFILEHHGTQRIGFFYDAAVEEYGEDAVDPDDYAYPGPKPQSKETAIAMLADTVESATRALKDPTGERIRELVDSVVDAKVASGQLDEAPLTFREVSRIKEQFVKVLSGVYHHRIDYPETKHLTESRGGRGEGGEGTEVSGETDRTPETDADGEPGERTGPAAARSRRRKGVQDDHPELPLGDAATGDEEPDARGDAPRDGAGEGVGGPEEVSGTRLPTEGS